MALSLTRSLSFCMHKQRKQSACKHGKKNPGVHVALRRLGQARHSCIPCHLRCCARLRMYMLLLAAPV